MEALLCHSPGQALKVWEKRASSRDKAISYYLKIVSCRSQLNSMRGENCRCETRKAKSSGWRLYAVDEISSTADPANAQITWQIVAGAVAGVTPFIVAGIEFGKRIIAQRRCEVCGGSGLVLEEKEYFRCPGCVLEEILLWLKTEQVVSYSPA